MLTKRASGKLRKNKANRWMKNTGIGKNLFKKKRGLETCEVKEVHRGKKDCRKKEKESLKPTKHEKAARMGQESAGRKKEK